MHKLVILITVPPDDETFEQGWPEFLAQAEAMPGLLRETTSRVTHTLYGDIDCSMIHELHFGSLGVLANAMQSEPGKLAGQVLQRITRGRFALFFADHHEDSVQRLRPPAEEPDEAG